MPYTLHTGDARAETTNNERGKMEYEEFIKNLDILSIILILNKEGQL